MLQFIRVTVVEDHLDLDTPIEMGSGLIRLDQIIAIVPRNNPGLCEIILTHERIIVKGSAKYFTETISSFVGQPWDADGTDEEK